MAHARGPHGVGLWLCGFAGQWAIYLAALARWRGGRALADAAPPWLLLGWALAARLLLCGTPVWLSDDLYRYLLDGRVWAHGINPFRYAPADPHIIAVAGELAARVNHPDVRTIYPPVAQLIALVAAVLHLGPDGWRVLMSLADVGAMLAVGRLFGGAGWSWRAAAVYGLCPLAIWEAGANGHLEPWAALFVVLAAVAWQRGRAGLAGALLGLGALVKLYPLLLLPLWLRRPGFPRAAGAAVLVCVAGVGPFVANGVDVTAGLRAYLARWSFNGPVYAGLVLLTGWRDSWRWLPFLAVAVAGTIAGVRKAAPERAAGWLLCAFLTCSPTLHPWYALWILPWLGPCPAVALTAFVAAMGGSYAVWWNVAHHADWSVPPGATALIWALVAAGGVVQLARIRRAPAALD